MQTDRSGRFLHPAALLALLVSTISLAVVQCNPRPGYFTGGAIQFTNQQFYGWPQVMLDRTITQSLAATSTPLSMTTESQTMDKWNVSSLCTNLIVCLLLVGATVFCVERWNQRQHRMQFSFQDIAIAALAGAIVFAGYDPDYRVWSFPSFWPISHVMFDVCLLYTSPSPRD